MGLMIRRMGLIRMFPSDGRFFPFISKEGMLNKDIRDNEKPARKAKVEAFQAMGRPITNEEVRVSVLRSVC